MLPTKPQDARRLHAGNPWGLAMPLHILVGSGNARKTAGSLRCHVSSGRFPHGSFIQAEPGLAVSSPELCFVQMASELSLVELMMLGYELCGNYRLNKTSEPEGGFHKGRALTSVAALDSFVEKARGLKGRTNARKALRFITDGSASPMESALTLLLCLPYRLGGYGLPMPQLNYPIEVGTATRSMPGKQIYHADLFWLDEQVDVEYDSDAHHLTPEQHAHDGMRRNALQASGIVVLSATRKQIMNLTRTRKMVEDLSKLLDKRLCCPALEFDARHLELRKQLFSNRAAL